jgi:hypothetical protein
MPEIIPLTTLQKHGRLIAVGSFILLAVMGCAVYWLRKKNLKMKSRL